MINEKEVIQEAMEKGKKGKSHSSLSSNKLYKAAIEEERVWVQCNACEKWRSLPSNVDPSSLPDIWNCSLNTYDPLRMTCAAPEESYKQLEEESHVQLKNFLRSWVRRLKDGDRAESRLPSAAVTRGRKRKNENEWIQCCNPSCRKWRAVSRGIELPAMLKRMYKRKDSFWAGDKGGDLQWFCSMNSWDDSTASCAAPQEPLWNCRWNLGC